MSESEATYIPEPENSSANNILVDFEGAFDAVVKIEEAIFETLSDTERNSLREKMGVARGRIEEMRENKTPEQIDGAKGYAFAGFEGVHGGNRYTVKIDGTIGLLRSHTTQKCADKAKEIGIATPEFPGM